MALLLTPLELLERLAALVPAPRTPPWLRDHGVLAPHAAWRPLIVPEPARAQTADVAPGEDDPPIAARRIPWALLLRRVFAVEVWTCARCGGPASTSWPS